MPIQASFFAHPLRLLRTLIVISAVAGLALPVFAVDTGGGGGHSGGGGGGSTGGGGTGGSTGGGGGSSSSSSNSGGSSSTTQSAATNGPSKLVRLLDLDDARKLIAKKNWRGAIAMLVKIVAQQPNNADALNLLGFSLRNSGDMKNAELYYFKALQLQPKHLGANEYLGELYVMTGQTAKAEARLKVIGQICGNKTCEEYVDLSKALAAKA